MVGSTATAGGEGATLKRLTEVGTKSTAGIKTWPKDDRPREKLLKHGERSG